MHLKHIGPLGLTFLTSMLKTALNTNIILIWKLANIVPIPKPNKDIDKDTSYRPISLLSVIARTLEKSLFPYITANIPTMVHTEDQLKNSLIKIWFSRTKEQNKLLQQPPTSATVVHANNLFLKTQITKLAKSYFLLTLKRRLPDISAFTFLLLCASGYIRDSARVYVFVNKLSSEVNQSDECIKKYVISYSNIVSTFHIYIYKKII